MHATRAVRDRGGRDPPDALSADFDADYRALDLPPGASLRDIEDQARLLRAAFDADLVPDGLRAEALARASIINRAADELSRYWRANGRPPPTAAADVMATMSAVGAVVRALDEVVPELSEHVARAAAAQVTADAWAALPPRAPPVAPRPRPVLAAVGGGENLRLSIPAQDPPRRQGTHGPASFRDRLAAAVTSQSAAAANTIPTPPVAPTERGQGRGAEIALSMLVKLSVVAIALALTLWIRYRSDQAAADAAVSVVVAQPAGAVAIMPAPVIRPAKPALLAPSLRATGAAAPPAVRNPYSNDNSHYFKR